MKLVIDIITRGQDDYLAIACPEGSLLSDAGVGGGSTDQHAAQQALNAYFSRRDAVARDQPLLHETLPVTGTVRTLNVAVDPASIEALLRDAIEREACVSITGEKVDGTQYAFRRVWPTSVHGGAFTGTKYLHCRDAIHGQDRVFRVDLMTRAEVV